MSVLRCCSCIIISFNTIAVLFITEVDNLSYHFGLSERAKQRVDSFGYVELDDAQARQLSRTKAVCVLITVFVTLWLVTNGAATASMISGGGMAFGFKMSELLTTYSHMTRSQIAIFVATTFVVQAFSFGLFLSALAYQYDQHY